MNACSVEPVIVNVIYCRKKKWGVLRVVFDHMVSMRTLIQASYGTSTELVFDLVDVGHIKPNFYYKWLIWLTFIQVQSLNVFTSLYGLSCQCRAPPSQCWLQMVYTCTMEKQKSECNWKEMENAHFACCLCAHVSHNAVWVNVAQAQ